MYTVISSVTNVFLNDKAFFFCLLSVYDHCVLALQLRRYHYMQQENITARAYRSNIIIKSNVKVNGYTDSGRAYLSDKAIVMCTYMCSTRRVQTSYLSSRMSRFVEKRICFKRPRFKTRTRTHLEFASRIIIIINMTVVPAARRQ